MLEKTKGAVDKISKIIVYAVYAVIGVFVLGLVIYTTIIVFMISTPAGLIALATFLFLFAYGWLGLREHM